MALQSIGYSWGTLTNPTNPPNWPFAVCVLPSGRIVVGSWNAGGKKKYSDDNGLTWTDATGLGSGCYYTATVVRLSNGRILMGNASDYSLTYSDDNGATWGLTDAKIRYSGYLFQASSGRVFNSDYLNAEYSYSDDNGSTWTKKSLVNIGSGALRCMAQLASGRLLLFRVANINQFFYSDDNGDNWSLGGDGDSSWYGDSYCCYTLPSGRLLVLGWAQRYSDDGVTWLPMTISGAIDRNRGQDQCVRLNDGLLIWLSPGNYGSPNDQDGQLLYSYTDGRTWHNDPVINGENIYFAAIAASPTTHSAVLIDYLGPIRQGTPEYGIRSWSDAVEASDTFYATEVPPFEPDMAATESADTCSISTIPPTYDLDFINAELGDPNFVNVIEQYKQSSRLKSIISSGLSQINDCQRIAYMMRNYQYVSNAFGDMLDMIGRVFGAERGTLNDSEYRDYIVRKAAGRGQITVDALIRILKGFYGASQVLYVGAEDGKAIIASTPVMNESDVVELLGAGVGVVCKSLDGFMWMRASESGDTASMAFGTQTAIEATLGVTEEGDTVASAIDTSVAINASLGATEGSDTASMNGYIGYLDYLDESEVSMLCYDGSDGKGNAFTLTSVFSDTLSHNSYCSWSSSDETKAVVTSNGVVSAVSGGTGDVTIYCSFAGVTKSCLFTVYSTLPSLSTLSGLKGGKGSNIEFLGQNVSALPSCYFVYKHNTTTPGVAGFIHKVASSSGAYLLSGATKFPNGRMYTTNTFWDYGYTYTPSNGSIVYGYVTNSTKQNSFNGSTWNTMSFVGSSSDTTSSTAPLSLMFGTTNHTNKYVFLSCSHTSNVSRADMASRTAVPYMYVPQNYVRYTNKTGRTDYARVLNIGTAGYDYYIAASNIPSQWFQV